MLNETRLFSSGFEFKAYEPSSKYYANSKDVIDNTLPAFPKLEGSV